MPQLASTAESKALKSFTAEIGTGYFVKRSSQVVTTSIANSRATTTGMITANPPKSPTPQTLRE